MKFPNKGGSRRERGYGDPYTGTKAETPDTDKGGPTALAMEAEPTAEGMEGKGLAEGNLRQQNAPRTLSREGAHSALERVREAARRDRELRFTALLHQTGRATPHLQMGGQYAQHFAQGYSQIQR